MHHLAIAALHTWKTFFFFNLKIALQSPFNTILQQTDRQNADGQENKVPCLLFWWLWRKDQLCKHWKQDQSGWLSLSRNPGGILEGGFFLFCFFSWFTWQPHKPILRSWSQVSPQLPRIGSQETKRPIKCRTVGVFILPTNQQVGRWCCDTHTRWGLIGLHLSCSLRPSLIHCLPMFSSPHQFIFYFLECVHVILIYLFYYFFFWHSSSTVWRCPIDAVSSQVCN